MPLFLSSRVSAEKSTDNFMGLSLDITCCFLFATLIFSLYLFMFLLPFYLQCFLVIYRLILFGTLCILDLGVCSFPYLGKFSAIMSSTMFSVLLSLILLGPL